MSYISADKLRVGDIIRHQGLNRRIDNIRIVGSEFVIEGFNHEGEVNWEIVRYGFEDVPLGVGTYLTRTNRHQVKLAYTENLRLASYHYAKGLEKGDTFHLELYKEHLTLAYTGAKRE